MKGSIEIAKIIDHTLLKPDATESDIQRLCGEAREYGFFSVCVHPFFIRTARDMLSGSDVKITTVIGFPLGMNLSRVKVFEAIEANVLGADELDIVVNIGECKANNWGSVKREISDLVVATPDVIHKIIMETYYLTDDEKRAVSIAALDGGAEFIKTSTGFAPEGAVIRDIEIIRNATQRELGIKAAGGIRTLKEVSRFVDAGATRIGTSSGVAIITELQGLEKSKKNC
jgi:deoxyribose-phosphate aldolase